MKKKEEEELETQITAYNKDNEATRAQQEGDVALGQAMQEKPVKCRRLQVDLAAESSEGVC